MTLLQIDKRAVTVSEGQDLIDRTRLIDDPFGVPTIHIDRADVLKVEELAGQYKAKSMSLRKRFGDQGPELDVLSPKLQKLLNSRALGEKTIIEKFLLSTAFQNNIGAVFAKDKFDKNDVNRTYPLVHKEFDKSADSYKRSIYNGPLGNTTFCVGEENAFVFSKKSTVALLNGADKFHHLWHEIAHGTGAGEPQADFMAAIVTRQAFASPMPFLRMWADERVLNTLLEFKDSKNIGKYGWGCVDVNDYVAELPEDKILGLDEQQIKNLRFNRFDPLAKTVFEVGSSMRTILPYSDRPLNLLEAAGEAEYLATTKFKDDDIAKYMSRRFALACTRSTLGYRAYSAPIEIKPPQGKYPSFIDEPEI